MYVCACVRAFVCTYMHAYRRVFGDLGTFVLQHVGVHARVHVNVRLRFCLHVGADEWARRACTFVFVFVGACGCHMDLCITRYQYSHRCYGSKLFRHTCICERGEGVSW